MPSSRRLARIAALQTLYEVDSAGHPVGDVLRRNLDEPTSENPNSEPLADPQGRAFARSLVFGVLQNAEELDVLIEKSAPNWPIDQMSPIDKTILRLAIFEILFDNKVPLKAAINEAVELGKRFGSDSSSRFINGVLGTVATLSLQRGRSAAPEAIDETYDEEAESDSELPDGPLSIDAAVDDAGEEHE